MATIGSKLTVILAFTTLCLYQAQAQISEQILYNGIEYFYTRSMDVDFYEARQHCFQYGGDLVAIDSADVHQFIVDWYNDAYGHFWLGMKKDDKGTFRWLNGSAPLTFTNWGEDQDLNEDLFQCATRIISDEYTWIVGNCGSVRHKTTMCQRLENETEPITSPPPVPLGFCPEGYIGLDGQEKCYQVNIRTAEDGMNWHEARDHCKSSPGTQPDLASFHDMKEIALVATQLVGRPIGLWIGMILDENDYMWADNSPISLENWAKDEPKFSSQETCGELEVEPGPAGTWRSNMCSIRRGFICQILRTPDNIISTPPPVPPSNCAEGYLPHGKSCYKLFSQAKSWNDADATCRNEGAVLATVHGHEENAVIQLVASEYEYAWIGLRDVESNREFFWTDDWPVIYTNWDIGEPSTTNHHDCVRVSPAGGWSVINCENFLPFVCKTTTETPPTLPPVTEGRCPDVMPSDDPWIEHGDYCYYPFDSSSPYASWLDALTQCIKLHPDASLVSIHDLMTNTFIRDLVLTYGNSNIWIGMHLAKGPMSNYQWIDGSTVQFTNWQINHPDPNADPDSACVSLATKTTNEQFQGTWREEKCDERRQYVCSVKKMVLPSTPPPTEDECPEGWDHYGDKCLYIAPNNITTWYGATKMCQEMAGPNATLASIEDENMNTIIRYALHDQSLTMYHRGFWLGGRSGHGLSPTWMDGSAFDYANWEDDEPKIPTSGHFACIEMHTFSGFWKLLDCQNSRGFACSVRKADLPREEEGGGPKEPNNGSGSNLQAIGIAYGVILAVGLLASVTIFIVLYKKVEKWKYFNATNYLNEYDNPAVRDTGDAVNYTADAEC